MSWAIKLAERGWLPDALIRVGIRRLLEQRLNTQSIAAKSALLATLRHGPIAHVPEAANQQHYEVPPPFFQHVLGPHLKYSGCYWPDGVNDLAAAEVAMLDLTCRRAELEDGMSVLELGCGWGSLCLWIAERYPGCRVVAVSNSRLQRSFIEEECARRSLHNLEVVTCDMNEFEAGRQFERILSVEMFEHMRNYRALMERVAGWLTPNGQLFVHVFCHRTLAYAFETEGAGNWMGRHFFTGGIMPSEDLLPQFQGKLELDAQWRLDGMHYAKTANAWLANLDRRRAEVLDALALTGNAEPAARQLQRWRMFFMACAELFGYDQGRQWGVAHYRFHRRASERAADGHTPDSLSTTAATPANRSRR